MYPYALAVVAFLRYEDHPTAVEYATLLALIIALCIGARRSSG
jgi:pilus assembly protein Flp/PilA